MATAPGTRLIVIMPAHNEAAQIRECLDAFVAQERRPDRLLVVDDNSTDGTGEIVAAYAASHPWITLVRKSSGSGHQPGAKVVDAFAFGLEQVREPYDHIGKFDADIVLPPQYFKKVLDAFRTHPRLGMCSGHLYVLQGGKWQYEGISGPEHVRGPVKLYSLDCFKAIGGLRRGIGWDTADVLLARFHGFGVLTLPELKVKHLRPTGSSYSAKHARLQGQVFRGLRYDPVLGLVASLKMAWKQKRPFLPVRHLQGYLHAGRTHNPALLTREEGRFARKWRWQQIRKKLF